MALSTDILGYWKFDETSGSTADDSAGSFDASLVNNAAPTSSGKINYGLSIPASSDYANVSSITDFGDEFTVSFWVYYSSGSLQYPRILSAPSNYIEIAIKASSGDLSIYSPSLSWKDDVESVTSNTWTFLAIKYDGTNVYTSKNGAAFSSIGAHTATTLDAFKVGEVYSGNSEGMVGKVDELAIWTRAITDSEVSELYNSGDGLAYPFGTDVTVEPSTLTTTLTLQTPSLDLISNATITPSALSLSTTATEPTYLIQITSGAQSLSATLKAPTIKIPINITINPSTLGVATILYDPDINLRISSFTDRGTVGSSAVRKNLWSIDGNTYGSGADFVRNW